VGTHTVTASYSGDGNFSASTSAGLTQTVTKASSTTVAISSANPSVFGQSVTLTATTTSSGPGSPTGVVIFSEGGTNIGQGTLSTSGGTTTASISTSSLAAGSHIITVSYSGDDTFLGGTTTLTQTVNPANTTTALVSSTNPARASQALTFTATVTANAPGAGTPTGTVQFQIDGSNFGSPVTLSGTQATSGAMNSLTVGSHTIKALYSGDSNFVTSGATLFQSVNPGPASILTVTGFPSLSIAGTKGSFTITVQDAFGNTATDYRGTVHFSSSDNLASLPADYSFTATDNGVHTFNAVLFTGGTQSLSAMDAVTGSITGIQSGIGISAAAPDHIRVVPAATTTVAGTPFGVTVTIQDAYNNTATGYNGSVSFSSADPHGATLPAGYTFVPADNGSHSFAAAATLYKVGTWDITVTDPGSGIAGSANVAVSPAPAVQFQIAAPTSSAANAPFDVTVTALDPYLNVDINYQGTIAFATSDLDPGVILPASYTFTAADAGVHTFTAGVTLVTPGNQTLTATDANSLTGSAVVTIVPPPSPPAPAGGGNGNAGGGNPDGTNAVPNGTSPQLVVGRSEASPCLEQSFAQPLTFPGMNQAIDLLFSDYSGNNGVLK
jgi:hypothetical protein